MWFDLQTLLALRVGIDVLISLAFLGQMRRLPAMGGPGWWSLASALHILGSTGLLLRGAIPDVLNFAYSNVAFIGTFACVWMGFRSHMGLPVIRLRLAGGALLLAIGFAALTIVIDSLQGRQILWTLAVLLVQGLFIRDMLRVQARPASAEFRTLRWVVVAEVLGMAGYVVAFAVLHLSFQQTTPVMVFYFLMTSLVRAIACNSLVLVRLREDADRARQTLQSREASARALVDNLSAGVMVFRPDHSMCRMNAAARRFMGWSEGGINPALPEPTSQGWQMLDEEGRPMRRHDMPFERVLATGLPVHNVVVGMPMSSNRAVRWALCNAFPETDGHGGLRRVVLTFIDITPLKVAQAEQKTLQARLAQSQKMQALGTLAGGVAHDFNNILAAILGNADLARQDIRHEGPAHESLDEISAAARRGRELVRQILAFSRQQPLELTRLEMAEVMAESGALLRAAMPSEVQLVQTFSGHVPPMLGDATQLVQVLVNLGTNALHALGARGGRIEFALDTVPPNHPGLPSELAQACREVGEDAVRLRVIDDGCGMDEALRSRIFEPFFTTKDVGEGTGLGLPVVLGIVQAHGGAIDVCSTPAHGTTFSLYFAATAQAAGTNEDKPVTITGVQNTTPPSTETAVAPANEPPRILYLDDDDTLVFLVRRLLERRGYRVDAFTSQADAIDAVRQNPRAFSLLLTDFNMPGMSGLDVAREVLTIEPGLTVAVASGYITDELQAEARALGVREVVFKTDAVESFCEVVARLVQPAAT